MVITLTAIQHPIKITYIIGIFKTNSLVPPTYAELMGGHRHMKEGHGGESYPHALQYQLMVVSPYGRTSTLHHTPGGSCTYYSYFHQYYDLRLYL